jgi:hypothetical protein
MLAWVCRCVWSSRLSTWLSRLLGHGLYWLGWLCVLSGCAQRNEGDHVRIDQRFRGARQSSLPFLCPVLLLWWPCPVNWHGLYCGTHGTPLPQEQGFRQKYSTRRGSEGPIIVPVVRKSLVGSFWIRVRRLHCISKTVPQGSRRSCKAYIWRGSLIKWHSCA